MGTPKAKVQIVCPTCGESAKDLKEGDKHAGGVSVCRYCNEEMSVSKVIVLKNEAAAPPAPAEGEDE